VTRIRPAGTAAVQGGRHCACLLQCMSPVMCRVSDAGPKGRSHVHSDRRPKAAKERTRGRWSAEGAAHSAMGIWLTRKVRATERNALGREQ